jgi:riboflavin biosynthesis pyrimidine reductase
LRPRYIEDPDTRQYLHELRQWIDVVQTGSNIGENETLIEKRFRSVQERAGWSITKWRDELEGSQQS